MAKRPALSRAEDDSVSSAASDTSPNILKSSTASSSAFSTQATSRASSAHTVPNASASESDMPRRRSSRRSLLKDASDTLQTTSVDSPASASAPTAHRTTKSGLTRNITGSKQNLLDDGVEALNMDWPAPTLPKPDYGIHRWNRAAVISDAPPDALDNATASEAMSRAEAEEIAKIDTAIAFLENCRPPAEHKTGIEDALALMKKARAKADERANGLGMTLLSPKAAMKESPPKKAAKPAPPKQTLKQSLLKFSKLKGPSSASSSSGPKPNSKLHTKATRKSTSRFSLRLPSRSVTKSSRSDKKVEGRSLRTRLSDEEKAARKKAEDEEKNKPVPDVGNRPSLPRGWAYVMEPPNKKTRLSETKEAHKKEIEQVELEQIETVRPIKDGNKRSDLTGKFNKVWVDKGLYAGQSSTFDPRVPGWKNRQTRAKENGSLDEVEKKGTFMSMPMFCGQDLLERGRDFKLPFDVFSPLPKEPKPEEWKKIRSNRFVGDAVHLWKTEDLNEMSQCLCTPETGCDDNCLNRGMMYECDQRNCPLKPEECANRQFAKLTERVKTRSKYEIGVEVLKTDSKGFGVRASRSFDENQIIVEYAGEIITKEECERRMMNEYKGKSDFYLMEFNQSMIIDATKGSIARFVNHSCEPNCTMEQWVVSGKPRMALFAKREIMTGEELTYDYNFDPFSTKNIQTCHCGSVFCRGTIGPKLSQEKEKARVLVMDLEKKEHQNYLRQFVTPFPKYTPSQTLTNAKRKLAELFGKTVEQYFGKKNKNGKRAAEEDVEPAKSSKKARVSTSTNNSPKKLAVPKRVTSVRKVTMTSTTKAGSTNRRSSVRVSSTSTGGTTLVNESTSGTPPSKANSLKRRQSTTSLAETSASKKRRGAPDLEPPGNKRRSLRMVD